MLFLKEILWMIFGDELLTVLMMIIGPQSGPIGVNIGPGRSF